MQGEPNYRELAALADQHGVPFDRVLRRWERGVREAPRLVGRVLPDETWITSDDAMALLGATFSGFWALVYEAPGAVRRRSRSLAGRGHRGVGSLYHREDLELVKQIITATGVSYRVAGRIAKAIRDGRIAA